MSEPEASSTPAHWDARYAKQGATGVSWYQHEPATSLDLIRISGLAPDAPVIDAGGGESHLAARLIEAGFTDVTVLDISASALDAARARLGANAPVQWVEADLRAWRPERTYALWHDRAVFHFMVSPRDRDAYIAAMDAAVAPDGFAIIATFAPEGPERCSDLPVARYAAADLAAALPARFTLLAERRESHTTPWGAIQPFTWILARAGG